MPPTSHCQSLPVPRLAAALHQQHATCPATTSTPTIGSATSACPPMSAWPPRKEWCGSCTSGSSGSSSVTAVPPPRSTPAPTSQTPPRLELLWRCHVPFLSLRPHAKCRPRSPPPSNPCPLAGRILPQKDAQSNPWMKFWPGTAQGPAPLVKFVPSCRR